MFHSRNLGLGTKGTIGEFEKDIENERETERSDNNSEKTMDLDRRVIYAAAATSLDSWDIENLRYIRQISRVHPDGTLTSSGDLDTVSYISEKVETDDPDSIPMLPGLKLLQKDNNTQVKAKEDDLKTKGSGIESVLKVNNGSNEDTHTADIKNQNNSNFINNNNNSKPNNKNKSKNNSFNKNNGTGAGTGTTEESCKAGNGNSKDCNGSGNEKDSNNNNDDNANANGTEDKKKEERLPLPLPLLHLKFDNDIDGNNNMNTLHGDVTTALDNCYLLDVVTVRNESVLAFTPSQKRPVVLSNSMESPSSMSSASSTSSCSIHLPSDKCIDVDADVHFLGSNPDIFHCEGKKDDGDFFDFSLDEESLHATINPKANLKVKMGLNSYARRNSMSNANSTTNMETTRSAINSQSRDNPDPSKRTNQLPVRPLVGRHCPFCDHENNPFFNCEQAVNLEDVSMQVTIGGEPPAAPPRSPSPYYVRLRRDLLTALTPPPHHLSTNRPRNFSVNTHGQLTIDYSSNWLGLENYVKNLKR